ncbi:1,2-epoxyphenylacetyl-CoA isomerase [compost metagenome]
MKDELPIRLEVSDGIATLTLCCPEKQNVIDRSWLATLQQHVQQLHERDDLRCVLLRAEGPIFCAGANVKEMAEHIANLPGHIDSLIQPAHQEVLRMAALPVPVVGLLHGIAAGGGMTLALSCDVLIATRSARLVPAYPKLATTSDMGLSYVLRERLGPQRALQLFLLSDTIEMDEAERLGLVYEVVDDSDAESAVQRVVQRLANEPSTAAKALFLHDRQANLAAQLGRERDSFLRCSRTESFRKRVLSFLAKGGKTKT